MVPHDLAGADLLDTRADLRQPVTGPARLSRRDVRVACTQVCFVGRGWWPSVYDGPVPALCQTVEMTLCAFCSVDTAVPIVATLAVYFTGAWGLTSSCCTSHSLLEHTMDRGQLFRDRAPADQVRMRMLWRMCGANPAGKPAYSQQHHLTPCGCPQRGAARLDRRVWRARRRRE